ncbi:MAG: shikimate kinase [Candidatus Vidania fulgoroideorum]
MIYLFYGFSGSGKTFNSKIIKKITKLKKIDCDNNIRNLFKINIKKKLYKKRKEINFRNIEKNIIKNINLLKKENIKNISIGGGMLCNYIFKIIIIKKNTFNILLKNKYKKKNKKILNKERIKIFNFIKIKIKK